MNDILQCIAVGIIIAVTVYYAIRRIFFKPPADCHDSSACSQCPLTDKCSRK